MVGLNIFVIEPAKKQACWGDSIDPAPAVHAITVIYVLLCILL